MISSLLPTCWAAVTLADLITEAKNGLACGGRSETGCIQLRMNNVDLDGHLDLRESIRIPVKNGEATDFSLQPGDVLFNNTNSTELVGKTALFTGHSEPVLYSNHFSRLRCESGRLFPAYLAHWLTKQQRSGVFQGLCNRWVNQSAVRKEALLSLAIPLPFPDDPKRSLKEQKRITAILDKAADIRRTRRKMHRCASDLVSSIFNETFHPWLTTAQSGLPRLGDPELSDIASGVTKGRRFNGQKTVIVPYIRVANVQDGFLNLSEIKTIEALPSDVEELRLKRGDVLMTEGGDFDKLGRGAMWEADIPDCIHQNHVFRVRCNRRTLLPVFLANYIRTEVARGYFLRCAKKTSNLASMNKTQLMATPVPTPPLKLQERFATEVEAITRLRGRQEEATRDAEAMFQSLVHRAFRGEL